MPTISLIVGPMARSISPFIQPQSARVIARITAHGRSSTRSALVSLGADGLG